MKVGIELGMTVCVNQELRNYGKFAFSISDIDTNGDVLAQAEEGVNAAMTVMTEGKIGLENEVVGILSDITSVDPEGIRGEFNTLRKDVLKLEKRYIPAIAEAVKSLRLQVEAHVEEARN